jgi:hypothetical protein
MEQSKALSRLLEAADFLSMLEDLTNPSVISKLNSGTISGLRLTIKNVRESVLASHDALAASLVAKSRASMSANAASSAELNREKPEQQVSYQMIQPEQIMPQTKRHDLRASLERIVEK